MSTVIAPQALSAVPPLASAAVYRMTVDEYERLASANILNDPRVELIDGYLVRKMTQKPPHAWVVETTRACLDRILPPGWFIREEKPVRIPQFDEPEPDLSVVRGQRDDFRVRHPEPADLGLLVEVSESSLDRDKAEKKLAYARGRVPHYWIVNLIDRRVEVFSDPTATGYRSSEVFAPGQLIPLILDGNTIGQIAVDDLLP
jgi:Uma2 family endonuclease